MGNLPRELLTTCYVNSRGETVRSHFNRATENLAGKGQSGGTDGEGNGGGLYLAAAASVCLDAFTQANVNHNSASTSDPDIYGSYTTCS